MKQITISHLSPEEYNQYAPFAEELVYYFVKVGKS